MSIWRPWPWPRTCPGCSLFSFSSSRRVCIIKKKKAYGILRLRAKIYLLPWEREVDKTPLFIFSLFAFVVQKSFWNILKKILTKDILLFYENIKYETSMKMKRTRTSTWKHRARKKRRWKQNQKIWKRKYLLQLQHYLRLRW